MEAPRKRGRPRKIKIEQPIIEVEEIVQLPEIPVVEDEQCEEIVNLPAMPSIPDENVIETVEEIHLAPEQTIIPQHYEIVVPIKKNDNKDKKAVLSKIKKYRESFVVLQSFKINDNATLEELNETLDEMRLAVSSKNTHALFKHAYLTGVNGIELVGSKIKAKLYGLSNLLSQSKDIDDCLKEIACEMNIGHIHPAKRLAFITVSSAFAVHSLNTKSEMLQNFSKDAVKDDIKNKYDSI